VGREEFGWGFVGPGRLKLSPTAADLS
jgi:hypothetical protein